MAKIAYQTEGFAYQGAGQFAYQETVGVEPSGVGGGRQFYYSADPMRTSTRLSNDDYIKSRLRPLPERPFSDESRAQRLARLRALADQRRREAAMRARAAEEAQVQAMVVALAKTQSELNAILEAKAIETYNQNMMTLITMAAKSL